MCWAGTRVVDGIPLCGRRVAAVFSDDESLYWNFDEDVYLDLF